MKTLSTDRPKYLQACFNLSFGTLLLICVLFLSVIYVLESSFAPANLPSGAILCSFEVLLSTLAAFKIVERLRAQRDPDIRRGLGLLSVFLGLLAMTDGAYMFLFYFLNIPRTDLLAVALCTLPYSLAFLSCTYAIVLLSRSGRELYTHWKSSILPLTLSTPVLIKLLKYLVPLLFQSYNVNGLSLYLIAKLFNISTSFLLINTALAVLLRTRDKHWSLFSVGTIFIVLANWALETQNLTGIPFSFGFYEFFWAAGIILCMFAITLSKETSFDFTSQKEFSLISHYRHLILVIIGISLVVIHFLYPMNATAIRIVTGLTAIGCLASVLMSQVLAEKIIALISNFGSAAGTGDDLQSIINTRLAQEITLERNAEGQRRQARQEANEKLNLLAAQFAHDIRSPLAALDTALKQLATEPEDTSHLIRTVAARINTIASSLLKENSMSPASHSGTEQATRQPIWDAIESVIQEKRLIFCSTLIHSPYPEAKPRTGPAIEIEFTGDPAARTFSAHCQSTELKRIVSNLINNSFDALTGNHGKNQVSLTQIKPANQKTHLCLSVSDNGTGIPADIIPQLMQRGATFEKPGGTGLGLYHARQHVESWGGRIGIQSTPGSGTTVLISLI